MKDEQVFATLEELLMFNELMDNLINEETCMIDIVAKYHHVTKELCSYDTVLDDGHIYIEDEDDRYVINIESGIITKDTLDVCLAYRFNYEDNSEIYISFPLLETN